MKNMANYLTATVQYDRFGKDIREACDKMLEKSTHLNQVSQLSSLFIENNPISMKLIIFVGQTIFQSHEFSNEEILRRVSFMSEHELHRIYRILFKAY